MNYHKMNQSNRDALIQRIKFDLLRNKYILFAYLFGSFNNYDKEVGFRDIDIAIYYAPSIGDTLSEALNSGIKLSSKYNLLIDCVPFNEAPLYFRYHIFYEGTELFCKDEELRDKILEATVTEALDYMSIREEAIKELV